MSSMYVRDTISQQEQLERFKQICKNQKIKLTPQRIVIYKELIDNDAHPSTDMLYQRVRQIFPTISFDTVHRTLLTFHNIGVAEIVEGSGNPRRFDGNLTKHHHFQCIQCKKILDIYHEAYNHLPVPALVQDLGLITRQTVWFEGVCRKCCDDELTTSKEDDV